jgi:hypothetical protein
MKTERVTLLTTKEFKLFLRAEAQREGISVGELVRVRCEQKQSPDEIVLAKLTAELHEALNEARSSLKDGVREARSTMSELRSNRPNAPANDHRRRTRNAAK